MKTESSYTSDVLRHLRIMRPGWIVTKTNDRLSAAILDAFIIDDKGVTFWLEFKRAKTDTPNIEKLLTPGQALTVAKMQRLTAPHYILVRTPTKWRIYDAGGFVLDLTDSAKEVAEWLAH